MNINSYIEQLQLIECQIRVVWVASKLNVIVVSFCHFNNICLQTCAYLKVKSFACLCALLRFITVLLFVFQLKDQD